MIISPTRLVSCAILLVPLLPLHFRPELYFHTEWAFAMVCALAWFSNQQVLALPTVGKMPALWMFGLVAAASLASSAAGRGHGSQPMMVPLYCLFAASVYVLIRALLARGGESIGVAQGLATAMFFSGLLAVVPAAFQLNRLDPGFFFVLSRGEHPTVVGNIAQANQFGDWLWLAIVAGAYLGASRNIGDKVAILAMVPLTFFAVTTGSRSVWLYPFIVMLGTWLVGRKDDGVRKSFLRLIFIALVMQGLIHLIFVALGGYEAFGLVSSVDRLGERGDAVNGNVRTAIWLRTLEVIKDSPWLGSGSGSFVATAMEKLLANGGGVVPVGEHAHNFLLQMAVEYGVPVAILTFVWCGWWGRRCFVRKLDGAGAWSFSSLLVVATHSMLEYPLWLAYFLGLVAVHLAIVDSEIDFAPPVYSMPLWGQRVTGALGVAVLALLVMQYRPVEWADQEMRFQMTTGVGGVAGLPKLTDEMLEKLEAVPQFSPWRGRAEAATIIGAFPDRKDASLWLNRCRRVIQVDAAPLILARCSILMAVSGAADEADRIAELGCLGYTRKLERFPELLTHVGRLMNVTSMPRASCLPVISDPTAVAGSTARSASADGSAGGSGGQ